MFCSVVLSVLANVQPFCDKQLYSTLDASLTKENRFVMEMIYDEYLEEIHALETSQDELVSPVQFVQEQRDKEIQADILFDAFLDSILILQDGVEWNNAIQTVRRRALLSARKAHNPWPNTTWFDVATIGVTSSSVLSALDTFLVQFADDDRDDRFAAKIAKLQGNQEACVNAERRTMERWVIFNKIIEPYETIQTLSYSYPYIEKTNGGIGRTKFILLDGNSDVEQKKSIVRIFELHAAVYEKNILDLISLVKHTRINEGIDLLSNGCGISSKAKNAVLQKTAEIHEINITTIKSIQQLLTEEQLQKLEQEG